ncbi:MAG: hypothetical protein K9H64_02080 [Bacteroidales bacterium]|nr:hypothetical protein [Bacteroidales bacterium]MCF8454665.1 hypothetical protein [Bacteroidales bacterium]
MPYRRLPNTDAARIKAMKDAIHKSMKTPPFQLAFSHQALQRLKSFHPLFEQAMQRHKQAFKNQTERSKTFNELSRKARLYISHFLQVMSFMIQRGELPENTRKYYGLSTESRGLPNLTTDNELLEWGQRVIDGDMERQKSGGKMITNPTGAVVRVHFEKFADAFHLQKDLQKITNQTLSKLASMRDQADEIILLVWNEVEARYGELSDDEKRIQAIEYGLKYVYRPHEKERATKLSVADERAYRFANAGKSKAPEKEMEEAEIAQKESNQLSLFSSN